MRRLLPSAFSFYETDSANPLLIAAVARAKELAPRQVELTPTEGPTFEKRRTWGISNRTKIQLGAITIKNILGYRHGTYNFNLDGDGSVLPMSGIRPNGPIAVPGFDNPNFGNRTKTLTEELQFQGQGLDGRLDWIVGGFYSRTRQTVVSNYYVSLYDPFPMLIDASLDVRTRTTSKAVFGQATFKPLDKLSVTAGYRYTEDRTRSVNTTVNNLVNPFFGLFPCGIDIPGHDPTDLTGCFREQRSSFNAGAYNISADYRLASQWLVYIAHRHGSNPGGVNTLALPPAYARFQSYGSEKIDDLEVGVKGSWHSSGLSGFVTMAGYRSWYKGRQRSFPVTTGSVVINAADSVITGVEIQSNIKWKGLSLDAAYTHTDARFDRFQDVDGVNLDGNAYAFVPKNKLNLSAQYVVDLKAAGRLTPSVNYLWQGKFFYTDQSNLYPSAFIPSYDVLNARLAWSPVDDRLEIALFARNLTNKDYIQTGDRSLPGAGRVLYGEPRTYGIQIKARFGE